MFVERREECDSKPSVGDCIEYAVTSGCKKQIREQGESPDSDCSAPEDGKRDHARQESGESSARG